MINNTNTRLTTDGASRTLINVPRVPQCST